MKKVSQKTFQKIQEELKKAEEAFLNLKKIRTQPSANLTDRADMAEEERLAQQSFQRWESLYQDCLPIDNPTDNKRVVLGHQVTLTKGKEKIVRIIDGISLDATMISAESPFGRNLLGKKVGDRVNGLRIINIQ